MAAAHQTRGGFSRPCVGYAALFGGGRVGSAVVGFGYRVSAGSGGVGYRASLSLAGRPRVYFGRYGVGFACLAEAGFRAISTHHLPKLPAKVGSGCR